MTMAHVSTSPFLTRACERDLVMIGLRLIGADAILFGGEECGSGI